MKVVITAATENEWTRIAKTIKPLYTGKSGRFTVTFHTSGIGMLATSYALTKMMVEMQPDLVIQVGIAGCFNQQAKPGSIVIVENDFLGDTGVEEEGVFKDLFDLKLQNKNDYPFVNKAITNPWLSHIILPKLSKVTSVTVNEVTTRPERIIQLQTKYKPFVESMEGAALHYVGLQTATPFLQLRAISNYIGERDKSKWFIKEALTNLQTTVNKYLDTLYNMK